MKPAFDSKILVQTRRDKHWTQEDLAAASGVSARTIQRIERSGGGSLETWKALAAAFDVNVRTLETRGGSKTNDVSKVRFGYMGMGMAFTGCVAGCLFIWIPIFIGLGRGDGLAELWSFLIIAVGMTVYSIFHLTWCWRYLNRLS